MDLHLSDVVKEVREDRSLGLSIMALEKKYGISQSIISRWVRDIKATSPSFNNARTNEERLKEKGRKATSGLIINNDSARTLAAILYWCEGSKHPAVNFLAFTNSSKSLVQSFITLLRQGFPLDESKFRVHLQIHTDQSNEEMTKLWSDLLKIPLAQFYRPTVTVPRMKRKRLDYVGTCTIKYFDVKLLLEITGMFEGVSSKILEGCLSGR